MPVEGKRNLLFLDKQPAISLPKGWVQFWKLQKKQSLPIVYNGILIVIPPTHPNIERIEQKIRKFLLEEDV